MIRIRHTTDITTVGTVDWIEKVLVRLEKEGRKLSSLVT